MSKVPSILFYIVSAIQVVLGIFFFLNTKTDIQFGFAVVLLTMGLANLFRK